MEHFIQIILLMCICGVFVYIIFRAIGGHNKGMHAVYACVTIFVVIFILSVINNGCGYLVDTRHDLKAGAIIMNTVDSYKDQIDSVRNINSGYNTTERNLTKEIK